MAKIVDKVSIQLYGDEALQKEIITALQQVGLNAKAREGKEYVTKKGEEGYYQSVTVTK